MVLTPQEIKTITGFVKKEPRTVQDIARHIKKSWVTADSYIEKIKTQTGQLQTKVFRGGTQGALKIVYWNYEEGVEHDEIKRMLYDKIRLGRAKTDFDPLEIYQHVNEKKKKAFVEFYTDPLTSTKQGIIRFLNQVEHELYCFSGNISWLGMKENNIPIVEVIEELLQRKIHIRVVGRVDVSIMQNLNKVSRLMNDYPGQIEIRHAIQPLRGFIVDSSVVRLKDEKEASLYKKGEMKGDLRVFYEMYDTDWVYWMQQVFWNLYRGAPTAEQRMRELKRIF